MAPQDRGNEGRTVGNGDGLALLTYNRLWSTLQEEYGIASENGTAGVCRSIRRAI